MSRTQNNTSAWTALAVVALAAIGTMVVAGRSSLAADEVTQDGRIVDLSADAAGGLDHAAVPADEQTPAEPAYWLGIQGQPLDSAVLRTHLQLADDVGIVVENVVKDSPAEKAGLRVHDILIGIDGEQVTDMAALQHAVAASHGKPVELKVIRLAKEEKVEITPEVRPEHIAAEDLGQQFDGIHGNLPMGDLQAMLKQLQQNQLGRGGARMFGPGMVFNGQAMGGQIPDGVQVSISRDGDGPATVTVRKGDQTWTVKGDDQEAIKNLPDDVRPFVEQILASQQAGPGIMQGIFNGELEGALPNALGQFNFDMDGDRAAAFGQRADEMSRNMLRRLEEMEKQIEQLQQQLEHGKSPDEGNHEADPSKI